MKFSIKSIDILIENLCFTDYVIVTEEISNLELEIERLNKEREIDIKYNKYLQKELAKANSIIKEVREYIMSELITEWDIKNGGHVSGSDLPVEVITPILKILDKENNNE